jgi:flagellar biosynthetic protein FliP
VLATLALVVTVLVTAFGSATAQAQPSVPSIPEPGAPATQPETSSPATPSDPNSPDPAAPGADGDQRGLVDGSPGPARDGERKGDGGLDIEIDFGGEEGGDPTEVPSRTVTIILGLTVLALAPSILIMMTSFTRIVVVLSLVRNALGVQSIPPNQVLVGLAMFLSLFVMAPVLSQINEEALQPYLDGEVTQSVALERAEGPIKDFMLANTRSSDLDLMLSMHGGETPEEPEDTSLVALTPAFVISELKSAFIIGIVVFIPFVVLDLVVSAVLMSLGMMMLPPVFVSLPLKLLLFVMVNGWALTVQSLVANYKGVT